MNKHYSILHISDLHKGENNDFDHLFASLCNDADSYDRNIPRPEIIVVCGDLAEGANGDNAEEKIVRQYDEVETFLNKLVQHFLNGDKSRIIIVPGNHDLYRGATINSMEAIPDTMRENAKERYRKQSFFVKAKQLLITKQTPKDLKSDLKVMDVESIDELYTQKKR